jgi:hypothetical protein
MGWGNENAAMETRPRFLGGYYDSKLVESLKRELEESRKKRSLSGIIKYSQSNDLQKLPEHIVESIDAMIKSTVGQFHSDGLVNPPYLGNAIALPADYPGGKTQKEHPVDYLGRTKSLDERLGPTVPYITAMVFTEKGGLEAYVPVDEMVRKGQLPTRPNQFLPWFASCHGSDMLLYGLMGRKNPYLTDETKYKMPDAPKKYERN